MTTIITKIGRDRVEVITDGGITTPRIKGPPTRFVEATTKVSLSPHIPLVVTATSGDVRAADLYKSAVLQLSTCGSFDQTIRLLQMDLDMWSRSIAEGKSEEYPAPTQVHVLGISESKGPCGYIYRSKKFSDNDTEPRIVHPSPKFYVIGSKLTAEEEACCTSIPSLEPIAIPMASALRHRRPRLMCGHADFTVVTADGRTTKRIIEWPDKPGDILEVA